MRLTREPRSGPATILLVACIATCGLGGGASAAKRPAICKAATSSRADGPVVVIVSAFPAELAPFVPVTEIESTVDVEGRSYYVGRLVGVHVVLGLTGIGMANAAARANAVLDHFPAAAILMSGVAGSTRRIGEVTIPVDWIADDGTPVVPVNDALYALAERAQNALPKPLEACTPVPPTNPAAPLVCMPFEPELALGGHGSSGDDYPDAYPCAPGGGPIAGCELPSLLVSDVLASAAGQTAPDIVDQETAAVARAAAEHGVPFLGIRAASDGAGDPLGDRQFPLQFFDYYQLAADNAAIVTRAVVAQVNQLAADHKSRRTCRLLARGKWDRAAKRIR